MTSHLPVDQFDTISCPTSIKCHIEVITKESAAFSAANSNLDHIAAVLPFLFVLGSKTSPVINTFPLFYLTYVNSVSSAKHHKQQTAC